MVCCNPASGAGNTQWRNGIKLDTRASHAATLARA